MSLRSPLNRLTPLLAPAFAALLIAGAGPAAPAALALETSASARPTTERARMNQRVFDRVWSEVRRDYYDPQLHGVNWRAARDVYRPLALAATDDRGLYEVLGRMLDLLDDDHAGVLPPAGVERADRYATRAVMGVTIARERDGATPIYRIEQVRRGSPAEAAGVQLGWRLVEADAVLSCFLPRHQEWATRTGRSGRAVVLRTFADCGELQTPAPNAVAVLVDRTSRSAAELTPAALQEARRAVVVGERTAGAVLISQDTPLPDGGRLTLSRADFVTRGGVRLEKRGVAPDIEVASTWADRREGRDPALALALRTLAAERAERASSPAAPGF
jgi:C-terminal processing protease CtpA/Prc